MLLLRRKANYYIPLIAQNICLKAHNYIKKTKKLKCLTQKINFNKLKNNFFKMFMYCYIRIAMSKLFQTSE